MELDQRTVYSQHSLKSQQNMLYSAGTLLYPDLRFDGWIHQSPNIVIVPVYYRLDSFGFLATPEFVDPMYGDFNVGFRDQVQTLKWVNWYISPFGGDSSRVTINGITAGGASVELHMTANHGERVFHSANCSRRLQEPTSHS